MLILQLLANGLAQGCLIALIALGFGLIYNTTRIFHLAHGAVYILAAYIFYEVFAVRELSIVVAFVLTISAATCFGVLVDEVIYRPLDRNDAPLSIHLLSSLGVYIVVVNAVALTWGNETKVLRADLQKVYTFGEVVITEMQVMTGAVFFVLFALLLTAMRRTSWGRKLRAMRDDPELLAVAGVNPSRIRRGVFGVGSGLVAVAAILLGLDVGIEPNIGLMAVLNGAVAVIVGGIGIFEGAALGAVLLGLLQSLAVWQASARWQEAIIFLVLALFLLFRPEGILGRRRRVEESAL